MKEKHFFMYLKKEKNQFHHTLSSSSSLCTIHVYKKLKKNEGKIIISIRGAHLYVWREKNCYRGLCNFLISSVPLVTNNISDCFSVTEYEMKIYKIMKYIYFFWPHLRISFLYFHILFLHVFLALSFGSCVYFFYVCSRESPMAYDEGVMRVMSGDIINILASSCVLSHSHSHNNARNILWAEYFPSFSFIFIVCAP